MGAAFKILNEHSSLLSSAAARCAAIAARQDNCVIRFHEIGWTPLPDGPFMLSTGSLRGVVVSADAEVRPFLKRLWTKCDRRACASRESGQDVPARNSPFLNRRCRKLLGSIWNWSEPDDMQILSSAWNQIDHRFDVCRMTSGADTEIRYVIIKTL